MDFNLIQERPIANVQQLIHAERHPAPAPVVTRGDVGHHIDHVEGEEFCIIIVYCDYFFALFMRWSKYPLHTAFHI